MITREQIEKMATEYAKQFDYAEDSSPFLDYIAGFEKALSLFAVTPSFPNGKKVLAALKEFSESLTDEEKEQMFSDEA